MKQSKNFIRLLQIANKTPSRKFLFFTYLKINLQKIIQHNSKRKEDEFFDWAHLMANNNSLMLKIDEYETINCVKLLPLEMVYKFSLCLSSSQENIKFHLLNFLENKNKGYLIKDKVLYFDLICKFQPKKAKEHIKTINIEDYNKCLSIAQASNCKFAEAFIFYKRGKDSQAFDLYAQM